MRADFLSRRVANRLTAVGTAVACVWVAAGSRFDASAVELANRGVYVFSVTGTAMADLYPGAVRRTRVSVANPYPFPIQVVSVQARVAETSKRGCKPTPANLTVGAYLGTLPLTVQARKRKAAGEFEARMPNSVANACQKATFRLAFTARASKVER